MTPVEFINNVWYNETTRQMLVHEPATDMAITFNGGGTILDYDWSWLVNRYCGRDDYNWYAQCVIKDNIITWTWGIISGEAYPLPDQIHKELLLMCCIK